MLIVLMFLISRNGQDCLDIHQILLNNNILWIVGQGFNLLTATTGKLK